MKKTNTASISPTRIRLRAPAKINWSLEVLGSRPDGFHEIDTVLRTISLADELTFTPRSTPLCRISCSNPAVPKDESNLIHRAWRLMREEFPDRVGGISVRLKKHIPIGAGLGGGSSDAAATLIALNKLFRLRLSREKLARFASMLGSDVPFFIYGGSARACGRGEIIAPIRSRLRPMILVVVYPGWPSPTRLAYQKLNAPPFKAKTRRKMSSADQVVRAVQSGDATHLFQSLRNDFDEVLSRRDSRYRRIKKAMIEAGLERPMLSGSGSACFARAETTKEAVLARQRLLSRYPRTFIVCPA